MTEYSNEAEKPPGKRRLTRTAFVASSFGATITVVFFVSLWLATERVVESSRLWAAILIVANLFSLSGVFCGIIGVVRGGRFRSLLGLSIVFGTLVLLYWVGTIVWAFTFWV
ncbi:MAG: hypothetical protein EA383_15755 [Spirochaetaceae bacterium]|nr:MAG: hypothetical protein EA383_15755 [Spirochaetaceae bacterium]